MKILLCACLPVYGAHSAPTHRGSMCIKHGQAPSPGLKPRGTHKVLLMRCSSGGAATQCRKYRCIVCVHVLTDIFRQVYPIEHLHTCCVYVFILQIVPRYLVSTNQPAWSKKLSFSCASMHKISQISAKDLIPAKSSSYCGSNPLLRKHGSKAGYDT
jgi:hypothetical protein